MSMIEKVARALCKNGGVFPDAEGRTRLGEPVAAWTLYIPDARAAIEAMEPTEAMLIAGAVALSVPPTSSSSVWQAMKTAALEGEG